jgi:ABC-type transport system involved in cytochrome bd biosynthesis fused ATPase/permease subunit
MYLPPTPAFPCTNKPAVCSILLFQPGLFAPVPHQGLTSCKDTVIGNSLTKGISGGQMKRTNIGIALIADPRVLMLDEPTSGLDSFSANEVSE